MLIIVHVPDVRCHCLQGAADDLATYYKSEGCEDRALCAYRLKQVLAKMKAARQVEQHLGSSGSGNTVQQVQALAAEVVRRSETAGRAAAGMALTQLLHPHLRWGSTELGGREHQRAAAAGSAAETAPTAADAEALGDAAGPSGPAGAGVLSSNTASKLLEAASTPAVSAPAPATAGIQQARQAAFSQPAAGAGPSEQAGAQQAPLQAGPAQPASRQQQAAGPAPAHAAAASAAPSALTQEALLAQQSTLSSARTQLSRIIHGLDTAQVLAEASMQRPGAQNSAGTAAGADQVVTAGVVPAGRALATQPARQPRQQVMQQGFEQQMFPGFCPLLVPGPRQLRARAQEALQSVEQQWMGRMGGQLAQAQTAVRGLVAAPGLEPAVPTRAAAVQGSSASGEQTLGAGSSCEPAAAGSASAVAQGPGSAAGFQPGDQQGEQQGDQQGEQQQDGREAWGRKWAAVVASLGHAVPGEQGPLGRSTGAEAIGQAASGSGSSGRAAAAAARAGGGQQHSRDQPQLAVPGAAGLSLARAAQGPSCV